MGSKLQNITPTPRSIPLQQLQEITDDFSEERKLGQGAYGKVYRGEHKNGEEIAVKMLYNDSAGLDGEQFQNEFHNLMRLEHPNIVRLVGYCYETQHEYILFNGKPVFAEKISRALCFEYMRNGSLQMHLSEESDGHDWHTRYKIIKGTCEGLKYLHEALKEPIYHLDLKPDNILLDKNMEPKLADFGLSKLFGEEQTRITHSSIGTVGYLPPEYIRRNVISKMFDIFSLGVVMIKIVTGHTGYSKSADMSPKEFIDLVHGNWRNRLQVTWSGSSLEAYCQQVMTCTEIALSCVEDDRHKRPTILDIINRLNETETVIGKLKNDVGSPIDKISPYSGDKFTVNLVIPIPSGSVITSCSMFLPGSNRIIDIPIRAQDQAPQDMQCTDEFMVQSTKVNESLTDEDITENMFNKEVGEVADELNLTEVYHATSSPKEAKADVAPL